MAVGVWVEIPGGTQEQYQQTVRGLTGGDKLDSLGDWPVEGVLAHAAGPTENGWVVFDVWESEEAFERFSEILGPQMEAAGMNGQPKVFRLVNFVK